MSKIYETAIIEKRNVLNELRSNNMTVQELRFFSIYLSKINPWDISTRTVRFPIEDFQRIMGFGKLNIGQLKASINSLLCKIVSVPDERGGFTAFQLFKECTVSKNDDGEWYVEIDAHDKALSLMFDFKNRYFKYELWNALRLKSPNQVRMYEILKQYEGLGKRELSVQELRELLGIGKNEYSGRTGWSDFKRYVLDSCQQALKTSTDICFTYERGKTGKGGKWLTIVFYINKNKDYVDRLSLDEFIKIQPKPEPLMLDTAVEEEFEGQVTFDTLQDEYEEDKEDQEKEIDYGSDLANLLGSAALDDEFTPEQVRVIQDLVLKAVRSHDHMELCSYLLTQLHKMNVYAPKKEKRFVYLCKMIKNDIDK
jgi:plasmid replication initiation protein